ncbi:MAG: aldehyde oxidase, partial [Paenibacillaceae bacterium]|nr:aldehyde oxidase [Paenibacillaceae bacterium]
AHYRFAFDGGAYSDQGIGISKAAACDCTGPYNIDNVWCDSYCVYTNHTYATSFRGYGHPELTFAMERAMDKLAAELAMDPVELRLKNAIKPQHSTPTQAALNSSNVGDLTACLTKLKEMIRWDDGQVIRTDQGKVVAKGISCLWKTSSTATNAGAGAILTFNQDGSINLHTAAVELGQGSKTVLAQIAAEKFRMDVDKIHMVLETDTRYDPHQWKTVASSTTMLAGRAVMAAADDAIAQLKQMGAMALKCSPEDLDIAWGKVFLRDSPEFHVLIQNIASGYKYPNGNSVGGDIIGRGSYIVRHLSTLDEQTGSGKPGPQWTVGAQAVEVEYDPVDHSYRILKAATVLDAGKVLHPQTATGQMKGGMSMGLSFAATEGFLYDDSAVVVNPQLRTYKIMRFGEQPEYLVHFVETPLIDGPYGARGIGEYGIIGMPAALATALSAAAGTELYQLPLTSELIWSRCKEAT